MSPDFAPSITNANTRITVSVAWNARDTPDRGGRCWVRGRAAQQDPSSSTTHTDPDAAADE
jgi:hypothetical protein